MFHAVSKLDVVIFIFHDGVRECVIIDHKSTRFDATFPSDISPLPHTSSWHTHGTSEHMLTALCPQPSPVSVVCGRGARRGIWRMILPYYSLFFLYSCRSPDWLTWWIHQSGQWRSDSHRRTMREDNTHTLFAISIWSQIKSHDGNINLVLFPCLALFCFF